MTTKFRVRWFDLIAMTVTCVAIASFVLIGLYWPTP